jgi:hypothetical protein
LERDSSTAVAIFLETSEMEACLMNISVATLILDSESGVLRTTGEEQAG